DTYHQTPSTHIIDGIHFFQCANQVIPHFQCIIDKLFLFNHLQHGKSRHRGKVVAPKGCPQHPAPRLNVRVNENSSHREPIAHALGRSDQVRLDAGVLVGKEFSCSAVTGLYLIEDKHRSVLNTPGFQRSEKSIIRNLNPTDALNSLDDHCRDVFVQRSVQRTFIIEGKEHNFMACVEMRNYFGIVRSRYRAGGTTVEGFFEGNDLLSTRHEGSDLQRIFICFRSRVAEKQIIIRISGYPSEHFGKLTLKGILNAVGVKTDAFKLMFESCDVMRVTVTDRNYRVTSIQIEVLGALFIPNPGSFRLRRCNIKQRVYVE